MKKSLCKAYAKLIVRSGIAVRKNQPVVIKANVETYEFVTLVVEECYKAGSGRVIVDWVSQPIERLAYKNVRKSALSEVLPFEEALQAWETDALPAYIWLCSDDPDAFRGVDPEKKAEVTKARMKVLYPYRAKRDNHFQWCIAGVPSEKWARKVFPEARTGKQAIDKLWDAILFTARAADGYGIANWKEHDINLKTRCEYLNALHLTSLRYRSKNGTDFSVGLNPEIIFLAAGESTIEGDYFQPNIPSEEVFTTPIKGRASGIVYATKPLVYNGVVIKDFWVKFEDGKAVDVGAKEGEETLRSILSIDEGSAYLGECALVPFDSPINNTGLLFYNTLYDENASCHLALGRGFPSLLPGYEKMTPEEIKSHGINQSSSHVDFMIGSEDLEIYGTKGDGTMVKIFEKGNWAF